jgi:hypothetical protein
MSSKPLPESEKQKMRQLLQKIREQETNLENIENEKKRVRLEKQACKTVAVKPLVDDPEADEIDTRDVKLCKVRVASHRRPSLATTYEAIQKVMGAEGLKEVKEAVREFKAKNKAEAAETTIRLTKIGDERKTRSDKLPETETKKAKRKAVAAEKKRFMRKKPRQ